jgi:hypothetical protein
MRSVLRGLLFAAGALAAFMPPATAQSGKAASGHDLQRHMSSKDNPK